MTGNRSSDAQAAGNAGDAASFVFTVGEQDTVGAAIAGMPFVAATPYLVLIAETACYRLALPLLDEGQITVGSRVMIEHLGPSKVGAELRVDARLTARDGRKFHFTAEIFDAGRLVARVEHSRAAVSREKLLSALA